MGWEGVVDVGVVFVPQTHFEKLAAMTHKHANLYTQTNLKLGVVRKTYYTAGLPTASGHLID